MSDSPQPTASASASASSTAGATPASPPPPPAISERSAMPTGPRPLFNSPQSMGISAFRLGMRAGVDAGAMAPMHGGASGHFATKFEALEKQNAVLTGTLNELKEQIQMMADQQDSYIGELIGELTGEVKKQSESMNALIKSVTDLAELANRQIDVMNKVVEKVDENTSAMNENGESIEELLVKQDAFEARLVELRKDIGMGSAQYAALASTKDDLVRRITQQKGQLKGKSTALAELKKRIQDMQHELIDLKRRDATGPFIKRPSPKSRARYAVEHAREFNEEHEGAPLPGGGGNISYQGGGAKRSRFEPAAAGASSSSSSSSSSSASAKAKGDAPEKLMTIKECRICGLAGGATPLFTSKIEAKEHYNTVEHLKNEQAYVANHATTESDEEYVYEEEEDDDEDE